MTNQAAENRHLAEERAEQQLEDAVRRRLDRSLEQGLEDSFPASDAISVIQPLRRAQDRRDRKPRGEGA